MTRSFVALTLPGSALDQLETLQGQLPVGRVMTRDTLHLTLAFLGEQTDDALQELHEELSQIQSPKVTLRFGRAGMYGSPKRPALGIEAEASQELTRLHSDVARALRRAGLTVQRRRFRPHVTIARLKGEAFADPRLLGFMEAAMSYRAEPVSVSQFALYESHLAPEGARHDVLAAYPLG